MLAQDFCRKTAPLHEKYIFLQKNLQMSNTISFSKNEMVSISLKEDYCISMIWGKCGHIWQSVVFRHFDLWLNLHSMESTN